MTKMDFSQIELRYIAEGNANLVVALPQLKKVLRLPKANISEMRGTKSSNQNQDLHQRNILSSDYTGSGITSDVTTHVTNHELDEKSVIRNDMVHPKDLVAFMSIVTRFIGEEYVNAPEIVDITSEKEIQIINDICRPFRPAHRLDKEFCGQFGLLLPDATFLPEHLAPELQHQLTPGDTFAVDIKPKQGWMLQDLQVEVVVDDETCDGRGKTSSMPLLLPFEFNGSTKCRYCAMQCWKVHSRKVAKANKYCPIDLYSRNSKAMQRALTALLENPQNNLRIFQNGRLIFGNHRESVTLDELKTIFNGDIRSLQDLVIACLLKNYSNNATDGQDNVLQKILNIQLLAKTFMVQQFGRTSSLSYKVKTYKWLNEFLSKGCSAALEDLTPLEKYLLATTLCDCSIIIAFKEISLKVEDRINNSNIVEVNGKTFLTKVTVLDLDPKPDNHFQKFIETTNVAYKCAEAVILNE